MRVVPGEVLRQQHKEHDAYRPHILSHIGNCDLLQESHIDNNDQDTQALWRSASCGRGPHDAVAQPRRLAVRLRHPKVTYAGSTIRINQHVLGLDVSVDDALGVQIMDAVNHIREQSEVSALADACIPLFWCDSLNN
jgi:hypothetical protein